MITGEACVGIGARDRSEAGEDGVPWAGRLVLPSTERRRETIEVWGGLECTVNRVGARFFDQVARAGHDSRREDIDRFAELGLRRIRYPVLWERLAPDSLTELRWSLADAPLARMRELGIAPIAGLLHHGSGPRYTSLLDPNFAEQLAEFAGAVARRYPWIDAWTPVNEPVTTARFSGLYGHWYPHRRSDADFIRMLLTECRGIVLAMKAIREVIPAATYVHTDDGGDVRATEPLQYQADFENQRRDLALDLLTGRMTADHPLWSYLRDHGATGDELEWFGEHATPPDVIGIDYYATSDRFLDHRIRGYAPADVGGNAQHRYADVACAGTLPDWEIGFAHALERVHARYGLPVALTEVHLHCTREEQLRWLAAAWRGANLAAERGADVRAVTGWAMLGAFDWDDLVTSDRGAYQVGAFDVRGGVPRRTAIGEAIKTLATTASFDHPVLTRPGWWERASRSSLIPAANERRILILGATGSLGSAFQRACEQRGLSYQALTRRELDVSVAMDVRRAISACRPWAVVNATGYVAVDAAEDDAERCRLDNTAAALHVAEGCARIGARLVTFSSDLVFDGAQRTPYVESDAPHPLNVYGMSKLAAEEGVRSRLPSALVVRTSAFFGTRSGDDFLARALCALGDGAPAAAPRLVVTPTFVPALVDACLDLLIDGASGVWHLSSQSPMEWYDFVRLAARLAGLDPALVHACDPDEIGWTAPRPAYSALGSVHGRLLPSLEESLEAFTASGAHRLAHAR